MMKEKVGYFAFGFSLLLIVSCTSRKSLNPDNISDVDSIAITDSIHPDSLHHPLPDEFMDGHTPPPPPPDGKHFDGPPPPPPHGKGRPPHKPDNMRGFDPASEDDMEDSGMGRYMENNDEEGWDYSWQYGRMFNEAYRLCSFVITTPVPETKVSQVANEASSLFFRDMKLPKGCRPPIPNAIDMILSYHILGMVNAILMWANDRTDSVDRFIDALYHYNDTGVIYRKGMLFEIRNHDFQFYHAVYLAQIVKQMIDASELRSRYDYGCRDGYLRKKFAWYKADADNYERMIKERRNKNSSESIPDRLPLPEALNRNDAQKYFKRAIEKGYMKYEGGKYEWLGVPNVKGPKSQLAYFCGKVYGYEWGIVDGNPKNIVYGNIGTELPEGELIALFGVNKLCQLLHQVYSAGKIQGWRNNIDALFE